jgi:hypothetical protein
LEKGSHFTNIGAHGKFGRIQTQTAVGVIFTFSDTRNNLNGVALHLKQRQTTALACSNILNFEKKKKRRVKSKI